MIQSDVSRNVENNQTLSGIEVENGLTYNPETISIEGKYQDELALQRVKRTWCTIFETDFLLIPENDFQVIKKPHLESNSFGISCVFTSACGRYAFWRLINEQAPEVQFLLETAHLSHCFSDYESFIESVTVPAKTQDRSRIERIIASITEPLSALRRMLRI